MPEFSGIKVSQDTAACVKFRDVHKVELDRDVHRIVTEPVGHIGSGQNSGFQALNLAVQFGARRIVLVGLDMRLDRGDHWHGRHAGLSNPSQRFVNKWIAVFEDNAALLKSLGVEVVNASPDSALKAFPKMTLTDALNAWRLQAA